MGRSMKRSLPKERAQLWRAVRGPFGRWVVVNEQGQEPLRSPDPLAQMMAVHLAAAAPTLREVLEEVARRLIHLETPYTRDHDRARWALGVLAVSRPMGHDLAPALATRQQQQLDLSTDVA